MSPGATEASPATFAGEAALVTGASRGIGQAVALELARRGADVALVQRGAAEETAAAVEALGRQAVVVRADLAEPAAAERAVEEAADALGRLDVLVANAGEILRKPAIETTVAEFRRTIALNVTSVFAASRAAARRFLSQAGRAGPAPTPTDRDAGPAAGVGPGPARPLPGGEGVGAGPDRPSGAPPATIGRIVHVASVLSYQGGLNVCAYAASKGAVAQLTRSLANEWAPLGIRVNAVAPGYVANEQTAPLRADAARFASISERIPAGRWAASEEIAGAVAFLASPDAVYVHGHVLAVDGGWLGR